MLLAIEELVKKHSFLHYFPSYEIMMDDLRDYRFYESDMIHPNETAIQYIWRKFQDSYFEADTLLLLEKISAIKKASEHKPFHPQSEAHLTFVKKQLEKIQKLRDVETLIDFEEEETRFRAWM